jgi:hypothetical protein
LFPQKGSRKIELEFMTSNTIVRKRSDPRDGNDRNNDCGQSQNGIGVCEIQSPSKFPVPFWQHYSLIVLIEIEDAEFPIGGIVMQLIIHVSVLLCCILRKFIGNVNEWLRKHRVRYKSFLDSI